MLRHSAVLRRSEPSSRTALMGEQPNPWVLLHTQDATSRHRGAKRCRRYDILSQISLSIDYTFILFRMATYDNSYSVYKIELSQSENIGLQSLRD